MTAEENWDGLVQKAIREYDAALGHKPYAVEFPKHQCPTGGATVYVLPGNPYSHIDENADMPSRIVDVHPPEVPA